MDEENVATDSCLLTKTKLRIDTDSCKKTVRTSSDKKANMTMQTGTVMVCTHGLKGELFKLIVEMGYVTVGAMKIDRTPGYKP